MRRIDFTQRESSRPFLIAQNCEEKSRVYTTHASFQFHPFNFSPSKLLLSFSLSLFLSFCLCICWFKRVPFHAILLCSGTSRASFINISSRIYAERVSLVYSTKDEFSSPSISVVRYSLYAVSARLIVFQKFHTDDGCNILAQVFEASTYRQAVSRRWNCFMISSFEKKQKKRILFRLLKDVRKERKRESTKKKSIAKTCDISWFILY